MSGITPLLDTVLHEVLGKRIDAQPARDLNQPVKPMTAEGALRPLRSDSRIDTRGNQPALPDVGRSTGERPAGTAPATTTTGTPPPSTQTHLSESARTIADLLARFPAEPSTVRPSAPLMTGTETPNATALAGRLDESVRLSGLFYESHVARWFGGEQTRQQLLREPQMLRTTAAATQSEGGTAATTAERATAPPPAAERSAEALPRPTQQAAIAEGLQGIVRHQLEMLVNPVIRWEGDVWSGLFMALMIQPPDERDTGGGSSEAERDRQRHDERGWRSHIDVEVAAFGRLTASLWMRAERVDIDLGVADTGFRTALDDGTDALHARLEAHGFSDVRITVNPLPPT